MDARTKTSPVLEAPAPAPAGRALSFVIHAVFVFSGMAALLYQLSWQRSLLVLFGSNTESVALVVAAFLAGLGLGALVGGEVAARRSAYLVVIFATVELLIGLYGLVSLRVFHWVGETTLHGGTLATGGLAFALVLFPTLLMGATLPVLVSYRVTATHLVGQSVSALYFVNTLGAGLAAFLAPTVLFRHFGLSGTVNVAATLNLLSALSVLTAWWWHRRQP